MAAGESEREPGVVVELAEGEGDLGAEGELADAVGGGMVAEFCG